ncbi:MAG: DsbA family protein [Haloarculaceae archaeon]
MRRRPFVAALGSAAVGTLLAGCFGGSNDAPAPSPTPDSDSGSGSDGAAPATATPTPTPDWTLADSPVTTDLASQPHHGPDPTAADAVVVEFSDPSCPPCATFHREIMPDLESQLLDPHDVSFVARDVGVVHEWAPRAVRAEDATFDRDADAYWALKDFYYGHQSELTTENVLSRTETFLADETDLDAAAVVADVRDDAYQDVVDADRQAFEGSTARGVPAFYLFRDGEYRTRILGTQSATVFAAALGYQ